MERNQQEILQIDTAIVESQTKFKNIDFKTSIARDQLQV